MRIVERGGRARTRRHAHAASIGLAGLLLTVAAGTGLAATRAVVGGTIHPIVGSAIPDGVVLIEDDRITAVGARAAIDVPAGADVIDAAGLHVWPAMIDPHTVLGLTEIGSVRGTRDYDELGPVNPSATALHAIDPDGEILPVTRAGGVLLAGVVPRGGLVSGTVSAIALSGWTWEEMARNPAAALAIDWPSMRATAPWSRSEGDDDRTTWQDRLRELDDLLAEARAYAEARAADDPDREHDVQWEALVPVVEGRRPVFVAADTEAQIREAIAWTDRHDLRMVVISAAPGDRTTDAVHVAGLLAERGVVVVLEGFGVPQAALEPYDVGFDAAAVLHRAGVDVAFTVGSSYNVRNLPRHAARAVAFGLPRAAAERGLTLTAAEALGIDDRYGSIEVGKSATLLLVEGDLLETRSAVRAAFLDGDDVDLTSKHTRLYERYRSRPRLEDG